MKRKISPLPVAAGAVLLLAGVTGAASAQAGKAAATKSAPVRGWLDWRGPNQDGTSPEKGLPATVSPDAALWTMKISGAGSPVIANGKLFALGYSGQGPDLQEVLFCADAETGKKLWEHRFSDFLSDIIYDRYAIGSPCIDPETGNVYVVTAAGLFSAFTPQGKLVWQHSMMDEFGRLTFPNGRNGSPFIENELVITRYITSNWGADGPAKDRFYAFDKKTGDLVWTSSPGDRPKDNVFSRPVFAWRNGKRVFYTGLGCGNVACVNARTGEGIWRLPLSAGGVNPSVLLYKDRVIAIHADENLDNSEIGRQIAINSMAEGKPSEAGAPVLERAAEVWRNHLETISSSPVLVGNRIYQVTKTGSLAAVNADNGKILWEHKMAPDQLHASPLYADGKLYIPMHNGTFFIIQPSDQGAKELCKVQLEGRSLGAPAIWNGKVYVLTTDKLYCFGKKGGSSAQVAPAPTPAYPKAGQPVALQIIPSEVLLRPGQPQKFRIRGIDANGIPTGWLDASQAKWAKYIPPTARVRAEMNASFNAKGELMAAPGAPASAGAWEATLNGLKGYIRGRVLQTAPVKEDFEGYNLAVDHATEGVKFAFPPLPWNGARLKWEVRDVDGTKALAKTLDNQFFQRSTVFLGHPTEKNYTIEADVRTDGNRRTMSTVGLINQRYMVQLLGNAQEIEISSNQERIKQSAKFAWTPKTWYRLKMRVDTKPDGSGIVRAKAWKKGEAEPAAWNVEVEHKQAHTEGAPGLFGFTPNNLFRVYIDNLSITPNS